MKRFFSFGGGTLALLALGVLIGMIAWQLWSSRPEPALVPAPVSEPARVRAWDKVAARLRQADEEGAQAGALHLGRIEQFFAERQMHAGDFAEDVLGWSGKWAFVKDKLFGDGTGHQEFLRQTFERHLFTGDELQKVVQAAVAAYLSALEGQENALLVAIRADLSEEDLPGLRDLAALRSDETFLAEYQKLLTDVIPMVSRDLKITIGREAAVWVGTDIAAAITVRIASAVAVRLGISGGILSTGMASGAVTLGVGVVVGFIVDGMVDWIMRRCGYDPAADIARHTSGALDNIRHLLTEGDPEAKRSYEKLRLMQEQDPDASVREECRQAAEKMNAGGALGLRHELERLRQLRSQLREAALKKLVLEGGGQ